MLVCRHRILSHLDQEYLVEEAIMLKPEEVDNLTQVASQSYTNLIAAVDQIIAQALLSGVEILFTSDRRQYLTLAAQDELITGLTSMNLAGVNHHSTTLEIPDPSDPLTKYRLQIVFVTGLD